MDGHVARALAQAPPEARRQAVLLAVRRVLRAAGTLRHPLAREAIEALATGSRDPTLTDRIAAWAHELDESLNVAIVSYLTPKPKHPRPSRKLVGSFRRDGTGPTYEVVGIARDIAHVRYLVSGEEGDLPVSDVRRHQQAD